MEQTEQVEMRQCTIGEAVGSFGANAVKVLCYKYRSCERATRNETGHLTQSMYCGELCHHVSVSLQLRDPHVVRLFKLNLGHPFKVCIKADPFIRRRRHDSLILFRPISDAPALPLVLILPHSESKSQIDHADCLSSILIACSGRSSRCLPSLESLGITPYTLILGIERHVIPLVLVLDVKHMLVGRAVGLVDPHCHLALPQRHGIRRKCIFWMRLRVDCCRRLLTNMHLNEEFLPVKGRGAQEARAATPVDPLIDKEPQIGPTDLLARAQKAVSAQSILCHFARDCLQEQLRDHTAQTKRCSHLAKPAVQKVEDKRRFQIHKWQQLGIQWLLTTHLVQRRHANVPQAQAITVFFHAEAIFIVAKKPAQEHRRQVLAQAMN